MASTTTTIEINGITTDVPTGAIAWKYGDPTEPARWIYTKDEAREIAAEDASLLVMVDGSEA